MMIRVTRVNIPAMSTIGYGEGIDIETGEERTFLGDHRPMRHLGEAIQAAESEADLPLVDVAEGAVGWGMP